VRASLPILLRENKELGLKVFYVRAKGKVDWQPVYYPDTIASRQLEDEDGNPYDMYFGRIYWFGARDQKPFLTHTKDVFPDGLTTQLYDIRIQREERDNMVPHGKFLYSFVARGTTAREMDVYLLQGMKRLLATEDIEPVPRALVLKRLVAFTSKGFPNIPELDTMQQITAKLQTEVPWLNPENLEVMQANQDIRAALKRFPDIDAIIAQLNAEHELLALALSRRLTCVGSMQRTDGGELAPRFVRRPPAEVWTLTATATGARCYFRVAGAVREDGTLRVNKGMEGDLVPGQLLFAPGDGRSTLELQKKLVKPGMELPACWPTNTAE
jgi:hypothetical protein